MRSQEYFGGTTAVLAILIFAAGLATSSPAQSFKTLVSFDNTDGGVPVYMSLIQGADGNLYGTTGYGGTNKMGTVFKISATGALTSLYDFCTQANCADGSFSFSSLALGRGRNFYGTTKLGGANGQGTVFRITAAGVLTTLHSFNTTDGAEPFAGVVLARDGNFYGTTAYGGANNIGTVFKMSPAGAFTTLHSFAGSEGSSPYGALVQGTDGNFYGTTLLGGTSGGGTVFKMAPSGALTTLYSFCAQSSCADGEYPYDTLIQAADGNFYGTTEAGGTMGGCGALNCGTAFRITPVGTLTTFYNFCNGLGCNSGYFPTAGLVQGTDGNFYGAANYGGDFSQGAVFRLTPTGTLTKLHSFSGSDGLYPSGALLQATNGRFYGATFQGGTSNEGTVFEVSVGLGPFVETEPASGKVGASVLILGNNLTSATSVDFNGTPAAFTVISGSAISTTVPSGATSGPVAVNTTTGTLTTNVVFRVTN
jgi:uncharacterized repeat protein (TIGR03803 family)